MLILTWVVLNCLMVLVGLFILGRYRERSRKATTIGIVALCGFGVLGLMPLVLRQFAVGLFGPDSAFGTILAVIQLVGYTLCPLLLVIAIVIDRR